MLGSRATHFTCLFQPFILDPLKITILKVLADEEVEGKQQNHAPMMVMIEWMMMKLILITMVELMM